MKLKKKTDNDQNDDDETEISVGETFDVEDSKDSDFDLNMDSARFQGKKGQAGSRSRDS